MINPLTQKQIKQLGAMDSADLARKIQEIIDTLNEVEDPITHKKTGHQFKSKDLPTQITISIG